MIDFRQVNSDKTTMLLELKPKSQAKEFVTSESIEAGGDRNFINSLLPKF
jgi:hypothetical protein